MIVGILTTLIGVLVPVLGGLGGHDNNGVLAVWIIFMSIGGVVFCVSVPHALMKHYFLEKQKLQNNAIELTNIEAQEVVNQNEEETDLDKEIATLEKQKKIVELKRKIKDLEEIDEVASTSTLAV